MPTHTHTHTHTHYIRNTCTLSNFITPHYIALYNYLPTYILLTQASYCKLGRASLSTGKPLSVKATYDDVLLGDDRAEIVVCLSNLLAGTKKRELIII